MIENLSNTILNNNILLNIIIGIIIVSAFGSLWTQNFKTKMKKKSKHLTQKRLKLFHKVHILITDFLYSPILYLILMNNLSTLGFIVLSSIMISIFLFILICAIIISDSFYQLIIRYIFDIMEVEHKKLKLKKIEIDDSIQNAIKITNNSNNE